MGFSGEEVRIWKGCRQGGPERPTLWNILLDEVLPPVLARWQRTGKRFYLPTLAAAQHGQAPRNHGDAVCWATNFTFSGDLLLLAKSREDVRKMHVDVVTACDQWGLPQG